MKTKRMLMILAATMTFLPETSPAAPGEVSLDISALLKDGVQPSELGAFRAMAWTRRDDFPAVSSIVPYAGNRKHGPMALSLLEGRLQFHNEGRRSQDAQFDAAGLLVFEPAVAGSYALDGTITCFSGAQEAEDTPATAWAVVKFAEGATRFEVVHRDEGRGGRSFALRDYAELQDIRLAAGERLGLTIWRQRWQWYGGGGVANLRLALASGRSWTTGTPAPDTPPLPWSLDFTAGAKQPVEAGLPGYQGKADYATTADGQRVLDLSICGVNWSTLRLPEVQLWPNRAYRLTMTGTCIDQVEIIDGELAGLGRFSWQPSPVRRTWEVQFKPKEAMRLPPLQFQFRGHGRWQLERIAIEEQAAFTVPPPPALDRGELLANSAMALGKEGWLHGWNSRDTQLNPQQFGGYANGVWTIPPGDGSVTVFATTPLLLHWGKTYTAWVDADQPVTVELKRGDQVVRSWRLPSNEGQAAQGPFVLEPPDTGVFLPDANPLHYVIVHAARGNRVRRISLVEGLAAVPPPVETAVELVGARHQFDHHLRTTQPLTYRIAGSAIAAGTAGSLVVSDEQDRTVRTVPLVLAKLADGRIGVEGATPPLPAGWYELRFEVDNARANRRPLVVLPDADLAVANRHLGGRQTGAWGKITELGKERWQDYYDPGKIEACNEMGMSKAKIFTGWSACEPQQGQWIFGNDEEMTKLLERQVEVMIVLSYPPVWACAPNSKTPRDWGLYETAMRTMMTHWKGKVRLYVVANEPDLEHLPQDVHVRMSEIAFKVAREVDPEIRIVAGAVTTSGWYYLRESMRKGLLDHCDIISMHGYMRELSAHYGPASFLDFVKPIAEEMVKQGKVKPIWDTEAGFGFGIPEGRAGLPLSEVYLKGLITRQAAGIERYYTWGLADVGWPGGGHFSMFFGQNQRPMISRALTAGYVGLLGDATFTANLGDDAKGVHLYRFTTAAGETVLAGWISREGVERLPVAQPALAAGTLLDHMGRTLGACGPQIELTRQVRYAVGPGSALPDRFQAGTSH